jgi:hypothetical protein
MSFSQTGGVRIGRSALFSFSATWPFAKLTVDDAELALSCLTQTWIFPKSSIQRLRKFRGAFSTGLRIEHSLTRYPSFVVFWTFRFDELKRELEQRGHAVSGD